MLVALAALTLLRLVATLFDGGEWWGINFTQYLDVSIIVGCAVVTLFGIGVGIVSRKRPPDKASRGFESPLLIVGIVIAAGALFFFAALRVSLLGDSTLYLGMIARFIDHGELGKIWREPVPVLLTYLVAWIQKEFNFIIETAFPFRVTGALCGMAFTWIAIRISSHLFETRGARVMAAVLLMSAGGSLLFFGYVETYALPYVAVLAYSAALLGCVAGRVRINVAALLLLLCIVSHVQHVLLVPSFLALVYLRRGNMNAAKQVYVLLAASVGVMLLVYLGVMFSPGLWADTGDNPFILLRATAGVSYTLFSAQHLRDIINEYLLLASVPCLMIAVLAMARWRRLDFKAPEVVVLIVATTFMEAFLVGGYFGLGLARDWDVSASLGVMLALLALVLFRQAVDEREVRMLAPGIATTALAGIVAWIIVNVDTTAAQSRYESLLTLYRPIVHPRVSRFGYENLRKVFHHRGDYMGELRTLDSMVRILPWNFDVQSATLVMEEHEKVLGRPGAAEMQNILDAVDEIKSDSTLRSEVAGDEGQVRLGPHGSSDFITLGDYYVLGIIEQVQSYKFLDNASGQQHADAFIAHHPGLPYGYELKGKLLEYDGKQTQSIIEYGKAIERDSERARPYRQRALLELAINDWKSARSDLMMSLRWDPKYLQALQSMSILLKIEPPEARVDSDVEFTKSLLEKLIASYEAMHPSPVKPLQAAKGILAGMDD